MTDTKTKKCSCCGKRKRANQFWLSPARGYRYPYCNECRRYKSRASRLKSKYGLTTEQRATMESRCNGKCWICQSRPATDVDHCHDSGEVRGLLCWRCNVSLGHFGDDIERFVRATYYLMKGPFKFRQDENTPNN